MLLLMRPLLSMKNAPSVFYIPPTHNREPYDALLSDTMATDPSVEPMPLSSARFTLEVLPVWRVVRWKCPPVYECKSSARVASCASGGREIIGPVPGVSQRRRSWRYRIAGCAHRSQAATVFDK